MNTRTRAKVQRANTEQWYHIGDPLFEHLQETDPHLCSQTSRNVCHMLGKHNKSIRLECARKQLACPPPLFVQLFEITVETPYEGNTMTMSARSLGAPHTVHNTTVDDIFEYILRSDGIPQFERVVRAREDEFRRDLDVEMNILLHDDDLTHDERSARLNTLMLEKEERMIFGEPIFIIAYSTSTADFSRFAAACAQTFRGNVNRKIHKAARDLNMGPPLRLRASSRNDRVYYGVLFE